MIYRQLEDRIESALRAFPVVGIVGARQVGKTTLARSIASKRRQTVYLDLELPSDLAKLDEPEIYLRQHTDSLIILDEVQRKPELFPILRALVNENRRNGRFLILGSASPGLARQSAESLAGRIEYHELAPLSLDEISSREDGHSRIWNRGGYPLSYLSESDELSFRWRQAFIQTHLERDLPNLGIRVPATTLHRFWQMLAHVHGQAWNASKISTSLGVSPPTVRHYLDILQDTFMVRQLQPFHPNLKKRLVKSPKVYLRDTGLLHALLRVRSSDELLGHPSCGASWEGFAIEQIVASIPPTWSFYFYGTSAGAEIDLILDPPGRSDIIAVEVKRSLSPKPERGFWSALEDLEPVMSFVVYPGSELYPLRKNVFALPLSDLHKIQESGNIG